MNDRRTFKRIVDRWERTGSVSEPELRRLEEAVERGVSEAVRYRSLIPLMKRDLRERSAEAVLGAIEHQTVHPTAESGAMPSGGPAEHEPRLGRDRLPRVAVAAGAAVLLIAVALSSYVVGYRRGAQEAGPVAEMEEPAGEVGAEPAAVTPEDAVTVHFRVVMPEASEVSVVGDFNDWDPEVTPMSPRADGEIWTATLELQQGRSYTYNFMVDDDYLIPDPAAERVIRDSFGGKKSVMSL